MLVLGINRAQGNMNETLGHLIRNMLGIQSKGLGEFVGVFVVKIKSKISHTFKRNSEGYCSVLQSNMIEVLFC